MVSEVSTEPSPGWVNQTLPAAWRSGIPFAIVGSASIVVGGLIAAVTRPTGFEEGPWVAAFLVLVGGVAQILAGVGQATLVAEAPPSRTLAIELVAWNIGCAATIVGTLLANPAITSLGGAALIASLAVFLSAVVGPSARPGLLRTAYVAVVGFVVLSTPVGLALAWLRHR